MERWAQAASVTSRGCKEAPSTLEGVSALMGQDLDAEVPQGSVREAGLEDSPLPRQMLLKGWPPTQVLSKQYAEQGEVGRDWQRGPWAMCAGGPPTWEHVLSAPCWPDSSRGLLPLMDELLQGCTL